MSNDKHNELIDDVGISPIATNAAIETFEQFLGHIPETTIALDQAGTITWFNSQAARTLDIQIQMPVESLVDSGSIQKLHRSLEKVRSGEDVITELVFVIENRPVLFSIHIFLYERHLILMARQSAEDADRFLEMSSMLSQFATLYRESSQQRNELEQQGEMLTRLSRELNGERRRLLSLIDQLPEGVVLVNDSSGTIVLSNLRVQELWNLETAPVDVGEIPLYNLEGERVKQRDLPLINAIRTRDDDGPYEYLIYPSGEETAINVQVLASPVLDDENNVIGSTMSIVDMSEQKRMRDELAIQAVQDPLTGLGNRRKLFRDVTQALAASRDNDVFVSVLYVDLDGFKAINDHLGHDVGDEALKEVAARLRRAVRDNDTVARIGGDEFAVLLPAISGKEDVEVIVRRILDVLSNAMDVGNQRVRLPGSVGICIVPAGTEVSAEEMVRRSDMAMYQAKATGSARWSYYDEFSGDARQTPLSLTDEIHHALDTEQFEMLYQPVLDLKSGRVREVEIAMFWRHHRDGLLDDNEIRSRSWRAGLLHAIAERAAELAEHDRPLMLEAIGQRPQIVMSRHYWIEYLREELVIDQIVEIGQDVRNTPIHVRMELSGRLMRGDDALLKNLLRIHESGIGFSIAHAGDYDGDLALLRHLPVEAIVASSDLVRSAPHDPRSTRLLRSILATAREFEIPTKAAGIDSAPQLDLMRKLGFDLGSGAFFSQPLTATELLELSIDHVYQIYSDN